MDRDTAFTTFVDARYPAMTRTASLLTGSRHAGEDLLQEALLRTYSSWYRIEATEVAEAYVRTTMVRLLLRDRKRRWSGEIPVERMPEMPAPGADAITGEAVRSALRSLPVDQRAAIVLRYFHDLTEAQTADVLDCAPGTVKSRVARGLATLRASNLLRDDPITPGRQS